MRDPVLRGRHKMTDGFRVLADKGWRVVRWVLAGGTASVESNGVLRHEIGGKARLVARGGTVIARDESDCRAVGPVQVFAYDRSRIHARRDLSGVAPFVRKAPTAHVSGEFDACLPLALCEEDDQVEDVLPLSVAEARPLIDEL